VPVLRHIGNTLKVSKCGARERWRISLEPIVTEREREREVFQRVKEESNILKKKSFH